MEKFGFTAEHVAAAALRLLGREDDARREEARSREGGATSAKPTSAEGRPFVSAERGVRNAEWGSLAVAVVR